ncbi:MAG: class I adenylate-forming enzyme family protein [Candidatus Helarchaeota archaeon]
MTEEIKTDLKNVNQAIDRACEQYPDNIAIRFKGEEIKYKDFQEKVMQVASALQKLGVKKGDRVAVVLANVPEYIYSFYGALRIGAVLSPMIKMQKPDQIASNCTEAECKVLIIADDGKRTYKKTKKADKYLEHTIVVGENTFEGTTNWKDFIATGSKDYISSGDIGLDDWATINFTSGTTGKPKGTIHSHRNYVYAAIGQRMAIKGTPDDSAVLVLPMYHIFGLSVMNATLNLGGMLNMLPGFLVQDCLKELCHPRTSTFYAVPAMYAIMLSQENINDFIGKFSPNLKFVLSGAAPLPVGLIRRMEKIFIDTNGRQIPIVEGYGTTEDSVYGSVNPWEDPSKIKYGSIGKPFPGCKMLIVDEDGNKVPQGERGEIAVQNPGVMLGYYKMPEKTKEVLKPVKGEEGIFYYTGDIGLIDEEGYYYIVDRKKDLIIVGGRNVIPRDVEEVLFKHPKIHEATVVGAPHEKMGETVRAIIVLKKGEEMTEQEVLEYCKEHLADYKCPRIIEFTNMLKKTSTGKVLKKDYRASFKEIRGD